MFLRLFVSKGSSRQEILKKNASNLAERLVKRRYETFFAPNFSIFYPAHGVKNVYFDWKLGN